MSYGGSSAPQARAESRLLSLRSSAAPSLVAVAAGDHFLVRLETGDGAGPLVAVKDLIDVAGCPTTAGCLAVAEVAEPAAVDAACLLGFRAAGARIVGKTALNELAHGVNGENQWYGTPVNPLDPALMPGGSSSGSAVAVARGDAVIALGTDTGGSIRIPAACCGVVGLKTTVGSLPLDGIRPLAPSFDTVGPMARDVAGVAVGYSLLLGTELVPSPPPPPLGRVARLIGIPEVDVEIDQAVDEALAAGGCQVLEVEVPSWGAAFDAHRVILGAEAWQANGHLLGSPGLGDDVAAKLERGRSITPSAVTNARAIGSAFRDELERILAEVTAIALPTIPCPPPVVGSDWTRLVWLTAPINLAGLPALALPVPAPSFPASLQLVGTAGAERTLLVLGAMVEQAVSRPS